jgi:hypothetical protein
MGFEFLIQRPTIAPRSAPTTYHSTKRKVGLTVIGGGGTPRGGNMGALYIFPYPIIVFSMFCLATMNHYYAELFYVSPENFV